MRVALIKNDI